MPANIKVKSANKGSFKQPRTEDSARTAAIKQMAKDRGILKGVGGMKNAAKG